MSAEAQLADTYVGDIPAVHVAGRRLPRGGTAARVAAAGSVVASTVHLAVVPEHLGASVLHTAFFVAVAAAQGALAWAVWRRPTVRSAALGLLGTVGVVLLYVASRTVGLPQVLAGAAGHEGHGVGAIAHQPIPGTIGPGVPVMPGLEGNPGVEGVGALDLVALGAELAVVLALLALLPVARRRVAANLLLVVGATLWGSSLLLGGA